MKKMLTLCILLCTTFLFVCAQDLTPEEQRTKFIDQCKAYLGTPYKYGGISKTGMDCSGFIYISARQALDIKLPRRAEDLYNATERLDKAQLQPGDFLFFKSANSINHAAVYLGNDEFIHSASDGPKTGVIISKLSDSYWDSTFVGGGKFLPVATNPERIGQKIVEKAEAVSATVPKKTEPEVLPVAVMPDNEDDFVPVEAVPAGTENQGEVFTAIPVPGTISANDALAKEAAKQKEELAAKEAALKEAQARADEQSRALAEAQAQLRLAQEQAALKETQAKTAQMQSQQSLIAQETVQAAKEAKEAAEEATAAAKEATAAAKEAKAAAEEATAAAEDATIASKDALKAINMSYRSILSFPDVTISDDGFIY
ncbi:MAG: C40 family peptidase [Treponema sp.]|jgi:probable lipoprotein NlpC|nr:C40 family peptidase [Treponema sp.]